MKRLIIVIILMISVFAFAVYAQWDTQIWDNSNWDEGAQTTTTTTTPCVGCEWALAPWDTTKPYQTMNQNLYGDGWEIGVYVYWYMSPKKRKIILGIY